MAAQLITSFFSPVQIVALGIWSAVIGLAVHI